MSEEMDLLASSQRVIQVKGGGVIFFEADPWIFRGVGQNIKFSFDDLAIGVELRGSIKKKISW